MDRLSGVEERLDGSLDDPRALAGNLRDLARVNRWLGGLRLSMAGIERLAPGRAPLTVLDVGTGGADIPLALIDLGRATGRDIRVTAIDERPEVLAAAVRSTPRLSATGELTLHVADGRALPYPDDAFDIAHCSLLVHHLEPAAARIVLAEMGRVARLGVVVNDLIRGRRNWLGAWLLSHTLTGNPYTRHDAPLSVRRAYRVHELTALMTAAGLRVERTLTDPLRHRTMLCARARNGSS
ncbi:MAG TPA: methyltransferase domain-containing protein [Candidatus Limnocylindrales bacterium]|jgi:ubiquinone/menaquinone biosynthesis C-methylase UbiE|nr:methyltransferase domain-containing protein [Candidatus Limnocylindrales bacterium]